MIRYPLLLCAFALACDGPAPAVPVEAAPLVRTPTAILRDLPRAEGIADGELRRGLGAQLCAALVRRDAGAFRARLTDDFRGSLFAAEATPGPKDATLQLATHAADPAELDPAAFVVGLVGFLEGAGELTRCRARWPALTLTEDASWGRADLRLELVGTAIHRVEWTVEVSRTAAGWRLRRVVSGALARVRGPARAFVDVTDEVGVQMPMTAVAEENQRDLVDFGGRETVGGLAVLDWNADGSPDLAVWHRRRGLALFVNDGQGGFGPRLDLIPPRAVGDFLLFVDLDGDGATELVSSEIGACHEDVASLGLYTRRGDAFEVVPGGLPIRRPCTELQGADLRESESVVYQHLTAADVDGDGDLDVLATGFRGRHSRRERFNLFDSEDGERDLLFINEGGLRFAEQGEGRGLTARRWSYAALFHDFDGDGDADLYTTTVHGPNLLAINDGSGHFEQVTRAGLTENGRASGVTLADLDGDGALDLFVSNPWAAAGQRAASLVAPKLPEPMARSLARLSSGSRLLSKGVDRAGALGLADGGWVWGHAAFDLDSDGDRDLVVTNGVTTHSEKRGGDFSSLLWQRVASHARLRVADEAQALEDDAVTQIAASSFTGSFAGGQRNRAFVRVGEAFVEAAAALGLDTVGDGRAVAPLDFDGDGDLDLVVMGLQSLRVLENKLPVRHFLRVRVSPGAVVSVRAGGQKRVAVAALTQGFHTQPGDTLHFGLGAVDEVSGVEVRWPDGAVTKVEAPPADSTLHVTRAASETTPLRAWPARAQTPRPTPSMPVLSPAGRLGAIGRPGAPTLIVRLPPDAAPGRFVPFSELARRRPELRVVGVATEIAEPGALQAYIERHQLGFPGVLPTPKSRPLLEGITGCLFDARGRLERVWRGEISVAEVEARVAASRRPTARNDHWELALRLARGAGKERARKVMEGALVEHPDDQLTWRRHAEVLMANNDRPAALRVLGTAVALDENNANVWADLAQVLSMGGQAERAQERVDKALMLDPGNPRALTVAGVVMWLKGDRMSSQQFLEAALEMDPYYEPAQQSLARAKDPQQLPGPPKGKRGHGPPGHDQPGHEGHGHPGQPHPR